MRECTICGISKELSFNNFYRKGKGFKSECKDCSKARKKKHYISNHEEIRKRENYLRTKNKDRVRELSKKRYRENPEHYINKSKEWRKENSEWFREYYRNKRMDPLFRLVKSLRDRTYKALKGISKSRKTLAMLGCDVEFLREYIEPKFTDGMSWDNYGKWHIDHIKPCASFDLLDPKQQEICFHYTNLQPLWATDNQKKGAKTPPLGD